MLRSYLNERVIVAVGDLTKEKTDAIVNAANSTLLGGGGVDGAIHDAGGAKILEECRRIRASRYPNGLPTGEAVITGGGDLPARFVIHTVGPIYGRDQGRDAELLANSYKNSLLLAAENDLEIIAFPSISTGAFGYPKHEAARVSSLAVTEFLAENEQIKQVRLIFFAAGDAKTFINHCCF